MRQSLSAFVFLVHICILQMWSRGIYNDSRSLAYTILNMHVTLCTISKNQPLFHRYSLFLTSLRTAIRPGYFQIVFLLLELITWHSPFLSPDSLVVSNLCVMFGFWTAMLACMTHVTEISFLPLSDHLRQGFKHMRTNPTAQSLLLWEVLIHGVVPIMACFQMAASGHWPRSVENIFVASKGVATVLPLYTGIVALGACHWSWPLPYPLSMRIWTGMTAIFLIIAALFHAV